jgi:hypothetical protein
MFVVVLVNVIVVVVPVVLIVVVLVSLSLSCQWSEMVACCECGKQISQMPRPDEVVISFFGKTTVRVIVRKI